MVDVRRVHPDDWQEVRDVRLAALRDAPYAFGSTYARESRFAEADWRARLDGGARFVADLADRTVGYVGVLVAEDAGGVGDAADPADPAAVDLVSMWVRPDARGAGVGTALVRAVLAWAREQGAGRVRLWVTETNVHACRLYEGLGFVRTGQRQPLPSNRALDEIAMVCELDR